MSKGRSRVEGADRAARSLRAAGRSVDNLGAAASTASRIIASGARARAPRRTGALAASIRAAPEGGTARTVASIRYAGFVHYGARGRPARPFLTDAAEATEPAWLGAYEAQVRSIAATTRGA